MQLRYFFPTAPTMSAVGKVPQLFSFFFSSFSFSGPLSDWLEQTLVCSHWSTHSAVHTQNSLLSRLPSLSLGRPGLIPVAVGGIASPHGCGCQGDVQPSSPWLSRVCPALMAVAVEVMASRHRRRCRGDRGIYSSHGTSFYPEVISRSIDSGKLKY